MEGYRAFEVGIIDSDDFYAVNLPIDWDEAGRFWDELRARLQDKRGNWRKGEKHSIISFALYENTGGEYPDDPFRELVRINIRVYLVRKLQKYWFAGDKEGFYVFEQENEVRDGEEYKLFKHDFWRLDQVEDNVKNIIMEKQRFLEDKKTLDLITY